MKKFTLNNKSALIVIDVQNDFCPGGSLAVPEGDAIFGTVNKISPYFGKVVATKDWHPKDHISFASNHEGKKEYDEIMVKGEKQTLWPDHCVPGTDGADFHPDFDIRPVNLVLHKGLRTDLDSYSAFFENDKESVTGLEYYLRGFGIETVYVCGLAMDVCVFFTCIDALKLNFETFLISDATKPVDVPEGNAENAIKTMKEKGVKIIASEEIVQ